MEGIYIRFTMECDLGMKEIGNPVGGYQLQQPNPFLMHQIAPSGSIHPFIYSSIYAILVDI